MRTCALTSMAVAVQAMAVADSLATVDDNRAVELPGMIRLPVEGSRVGHHPGAAGVRRQVSSDLLNEQQGTQYLIRLRLGTPGQEVKVVFDTGSPRLWVNPDCSTSGDGESEEFCRSLGRFVPGASTVSLGQAGSIAYGRGQVRFDYVRDSVGLGGAEIADQVFGVAYASRHVAEGVLGVGPDLRGFDVAPHPTVLDSLARQGLIRGRAFSVDLRSVDSPRGAVVFGGADTKKFRGALRRRPVAARGPDGSVRYWIDLDGLTVHTPGGGARAGLAEGASLPVFLDTGATLGHLPRALVDAVAEGFPGARFDVVRGQHAVPCSLRGEDGTVDFKFGDALIKVPFGDFIWEAGADYCILGVVPSPDQSRTWSLGASFLRAAYAVFDQDNRDVWLAPSADCGTNLVAFGKGVDAVGPLEGDCGKPPVASASPATSSPVTSSSSSPTLSVSGSDSSAPTVPGAATGTSSPVTLSSSSPTFSVSSSDSPFPAVTGNPTGTSSSATLSSSSPTFSVSGSDSSVPSVTGAPTSSLSTGAGTATSSVLASISITGNGSTSVTGQSSTSIAGQRNGSTSTPWSSLNTTAAPNCTSTLLTTATSTITSCLPAVTGCTVGRVSTEVVTSHTTRCAGQQTATHAPPRPGEPGQPGTRENICPGPRCSTDDRPAVPGEAKPCATCDGVGSAGRPTAPGETRPCATCGGVGSSSGRPAAPPPVVAGAARRCCRVSGAVAVAAAVAALML